MKYVDEFRDPAAGRRWVDAIHRTASQRWTIMEVCGGQTHNLLRFGIDEALGDVVELIHGPGCPVCVTPREAIDAACALAQRGDVLLTSFGDMLRVPGSRGSLRRVQSQGGNVALVYAPTDAVELARCQPQRQVVFFAVGFETTAPATALAVLQAEKLGLKNFSVLVSHVCVLPAMEALAASEDCLIDGFLAAGHVCTVTGYADYEAFAARYRRPVVVTGFEPIDLLEGILACVRQLEAGTCRVENAYRRMVRREGNPAARKLLEQVYTPTDALWRGFGVMPRGGLRLAERYRPFDALERFSVEMPKVDSPCECRSAEVLSGRMKPTDCPHFANRCTPEAPLGAPMVSSEGACAAYYRYRADDAPRVTQTS